MRKTKKSRVIYSKGSGNVFEDLGLKDSEEFLGRGKLGRSVRLLLEERKLKQKDVSKVLEIKQPEVSNILNGKYNLFTTERLCKFLNKLDQKIVVTVSNRKKSESPFEVLYS